MAVLRDLGRVSSIPLEYAESAALPSLPQQIVVTETEAQFGPATHSGELDARRIQGSRTDVVQDVMFTSQKFPKPDLRIYYQIWHMSSVSVLSEVS